MSNPAKNIGEVTYVAYSYKGSISFGLVYIPIVLHSAVSDTSISFKLLEKKTKSRVKYKKTCEDCNEKEIGNQDIVKGFEYEDGKYVIFSEEDFENLKTPKNKTISIEQFINLQEVDPIYFDKSYYVEPTGGEKAFLLLLTAMEKEHKAGLAKTVLGTKEVLVLLSAVQGQMLLKTLFFETQIKKNPCKEINEKLQKAEIDLAKNLIAQMSAPFQPKKYKDEYRLRIEEAIEKKLQGKEIVASSKQAPSTALNLMEALQASLEAYPKSKKSLVIPKKKEGPRANV